MQSRSSAVRQFDLWAADQGSSAKSGRSITIRSRRIGVTPVFYAYWHFATERQEIFYRRLKGGSNRKLTNDPVLAHFKFTNVFRASDRVSQYLIRNVIYRDDLPKDAPNVFFRILLFKLFNKIETWEYLEEQIGALVWEKFDFLKFDRALTARMKSGQRIYSAAYIMPSAGSAFGHSSKHQNHLRLLEHMMGSSFPARLTDCTKMQESFDLLLSAPSIGPFLAYQFAIDLNYSALTNFSESEFVVAGPGALDGIHKCFLNAGEIPPEDFIRHMYENQEEHFMGLGVTPVTLWGRRLQLIDCQNIFCEISKYARVAFPEYTGLAGRTRIKQRFSLRKHLSTPWYPPDWGLNDRIKAELS